MCRDTSDSWDLEQTSRGVRSVVIFLEGAHTSRMNCFFQPTTSMHSSMRTLSDVSYGMLSRTWYFVISTASYKRVYIFK